MYSNIFQNMLYSSNISLINSKPLLKLLPQKSYFTTCMLPYENATSPQTQYLNKKVKEVKGQIVLLFGVSRGNSIFIYPTNQNQTTHISFKLVPFPHIPSTFSLPQLPFPSPSYIKDTLLYKDTHLILYTFLPNPINQTHHNVSLPI